MNRKDKIQLLKEIASGKVSANEVFTPPFAIWLQRGNEYCNVGNKKWISETEYNRRSAVIKVNIVVPENGRN